MQGSSSVTNHVPQNIHTLVQFLYDTLMQKAHVKNY